MHAHRCAYRDWRAISCILLHYSPHFLKSSLIGYAGWETSFEILLSQTATLTPSVEITGVYHPVFPVGSEDLSDMALTEPLPHSSCNK